MALPTGTASVAAGAGGNVPPTVCDCTGGAAAAFVVVGGVAPGVVVGVVPESASVGTTEISVTKKSHAMISLAWLLRIRNVAQR